MIRYSRSGVALVLALSYAGSPTATARDLRADHALPLVMAAGEVSASAPPAATKPGGEFKDCPVCPPMIVVPAGKFVMGSPPDESGRVDNEAPQHTVTIAQPFAVGKYEVTFDEWEACVAERACPRVDDSGYGRGRRPVINVSHQNAAGYLQWLSAKVNKKYRLLTEAEWEYAARAGSAKSRYWGAAVERTCAYANVFNPKTKTKYKDADRQAFPCDDGFMETAPVGSLKPNAFGLYDMLGNVWEWVEDCWNPSYADGPNDGSAWLTGDCTNRVMRGGGWYYGPRNVRLAKRLKNPAVNRGNDVGFRVARSLP